jgi:serine/threonine protein kinase
MNTTYNISMDLLSVYNRISAAEVFATRAARGSMGNLQLTGEGWLIKTDKLGIDVGVEWEYQVYEHMQNRELNLAPECSIEEGVWGYPSSIMLKTINNGATLRDYIEAFLVGLIPAEPLISLMETTSQLLSDFWENGYTHRDLHPRNIVIGLNKKGDAWRPYIIDFSSSTHESQLEEYCYEQALILEEMSLQEDDLATLKEEIWELVDEPPKDFHKVMKALEANITSI